MIDITEKEQKEIFSEIEKQISIALKSVRINNILWSKYRAANERTLSNVNVLNEFISKLYSSLRLEKNWKEEISVLDDDLNEKLTKILRKIRGGLEKKSVKPNRRLVYSLQIEDYNYCGVILDKNIKIIKDIISCYESRGCEIIGDDLSESLRCKIYSKFDNWEVKNLNLEALVIKYAKILSKDDSVTLEEWSEFLEEIIPSHRESCSSSCWVEI
jgi:hypothetical protein